jgi:1-phosphofructokinase family hexose kinase
MLTAADREIPTKRYTADILVASPNAAVDSYYLVPDLEVGGVNRAEQAFHTAGGKGNNLARAVKALGGQVMSLGILAGRSGEFVRDELEREGIAHGLVWTPGETRRSSTILVEGGMQTTVVLDPGSSIPVAAAESLADKIAASAGLAPYLVLTGSLPPSLPTGYYADIVRRVRAAPGLKVCLDCAGEALRLAVAEGVHVLKINRAEFAISFRTHSKQDGSWRLAETQEIFRSLQQYGLELLIVTDGAHGAYLFEPGKPPFRVFTPVERWVSTAGAGDTFMAALLLGQRRGMPLEEAACYASAAAAAKLMQVVCGSLDPVDLDYYLPRTQIEWL